MSSQETNYNSSSSEETPKKAKAKQILTAEQKERNRLYSREYRRRKSAEDPNFYKQNYEKENQRLYQQTYLEKKSSEDPDFKDKRKIAQREATRRMYAKYKGVLNAVKNNELIPSV
jgi:spore coat polysaccharide biosynthesis protein SpsF (cytidylyltransferase family)